jgi:hypothetical protein
MSTVNFAWCSAEAPELRQLPSKKKTKKNPPAATPGSSNPAAVQLPESPRRPAAAIPDAPNPAAPTIPQTSNSPAAVIPETPALRAAPVVDAPSDQPPKSPKGVHLLRVRFPAGMVAELQAGLKLRPCSVWGDGFCGLRVGCSMRNTGMEELVQDLEHFWDYDGFANVPPGTITYDTITNELGQKRFTELQRGGVDDGGAISTLRRVRAALENKSKRLNRRYWWADECWEHLSHIMQAPVLWIDCRTVIPGVHEQAFPFVLYLPSLPYVAVFKTLAEVQPFLNTRPPGETTVAHGAGFDGEHYCALLPPDVSPNFAGPDRIEAWD